jgi:hypothetical protein
MASASRTGLKRRRRRGKVEIQALNCNADRGIKYEAKTLFTVLRETNALRRLREAFDAGRAFRPRIATVPSDIEKIETSSIWLIERLLLRVARGTSCFQTTALRGPILAF